MSSSIAETAGAARQRLASSLGVLQQDQNLPTQVMDIVAGLARAIGPLFQVERATGAPELLFQARSVLQETLGRMQTVDNSHPGVADATAAIAQSLGMIFAAIKEHNLTDPATRPSTSAMPQVTAPAPQAPAPQSPAPQAPAPMPLVQPAAAPMPLVQPAVQPVPLVQPAAAPVPLVQPAVPHAAPAAAPPAAAPVYTAPAAAQSAPYVLPAQPQASSPYVAPMPAPYAPQAPTPAPYAPPAAAPSPRPAVHPTNSFLPETAAVVPTGPNGLPRLEAELDVHSDTNFYTNFLGDIHDHGGIFVATYAILHTGTQCEVQLTFPGELKADVRGVVRWRREPAGADVSAGAAGTVAGLGIEITQAAGDGWSLIERFIKKREPIIHEM